jgi:hypothetical protein
VTDWRGVLASGVLLAGVDEAGRGPLAGDVIAGAVILDPARPVPGLRDSKKVSRARRPQLAAAVREAAQAWAIGRASVAEIDRLNILQASLLAMRRAVEALALAPQFVLVDGNRCPAWAYPSAGRSWAATIWCLRSAPPRCWPRSQRDAEMVAGWMRMLSGLRLSPRTRATRPRSTWRRCAASVRVRCTGAPLRRCGPRLHNARWTRNEAAMSAGFVHLRLHSEYSLIDGLVRVDELVERAVALGMPAVALTDHTNLFALIKFYKEAQSAGIKPIVGCDVRVEHEGQTHALTLLVGAQEGYRNLTRLISRGWLEGQQLGRPVLARAWVEEFAGGLIALSGGREGDIGQALLGGRAEQASQLLDYWMALFPERFYLEVSRTGRPQEEDYLHLAVALAGRHGCPVVATNDVRFLDRSDYEAHEARVCIHEGRTLNDPRRQRQYSPYQYLRSAAEMAELFADLPEALENSVEIARRCNIGIELGKAYLPDYPVPAGMDIATFLGRAAHDGLGERLARVADREAREPEYRERLDFELQTINSMGFAGYFLIVMDFIRWAKNNGVPVGPGRGSGRGFAGGLRARHHRPRSAAVPPAVRALPESRAGVDAGLRRRFLHGGARPRDRLRGRHLRPRGGVADHHLRHHGGQGGGARRGARAGQVLRAGRQAVEADSVRGRHDARAKAMAQEQALRDFVEQNEDVAEIMDMAFKLEGLARNVGKHAGGVVIAPTTLTDFAPLYSDDSGGGLVTQFDKDDVEKVGAGEVRLPRPAHAHDHRLGAGDHQPASPSRAVRPSTSRRSRSTTPASMRC